MHILPRSGRHDTPFTSEKNTSADSQLSDSSAEPSVVEQGSANEGQESSFDTVDAGNTSGNDEPIKLGALEWRQVVGGHLVIQFTWGLINSFGVFMSYYEDRLHNEPSQLSWIGSTQVALIFMIAPLSGCLHDRGHARKTLAAGSFLVFFGMLMTSFGTAFAQYLLSQGVCVGIGNGLIFCTVTSLIQSHFKGSKHQNLAPTLALMGAASGGMIFPAMFDKLLPQVGFGWAIRCIASYIGVVSVVALLCFKQVRKPNKQAKFIDRDALKSVPFWTYAGSMFFVYLALFFGYYHITPYARLVVKIPREQGNFLLLTMNGVGAIGRIISGIAADRWMGPLSVMLVFTSVSGLLLFIMIAVKDLAGLWAFAVIYGIFAAGVQSLFPNALATFATDISKRGVWTGMTCFLVGIAALIGPPLEGLLVNKTGYMAAQIFAGCSFMIGTAGLVWTRQYLTGGVWLTKI
ncbi:MAG: hypothetical protein M1814_003982 [Vezdaea aestivalis]|nr:MAG: hypothetical protein M1814_003982 [Vezdaea aestivalis]